MEEHDLTAEETAEQAGAETPDAEETPEPLEEHHEWFESAAEGVGVSYIYIPGTSQEEGTLTFTDHDGDREHEITGQNARDQLNSLIESSDEEKASTIRTFFS